MRFNYESTLINVRHFFLRLYIKGEESEWHSRYSDWLRAGRQKGLSLSPSMIKKFSSPYCPDRLWHPSIQWVPGALLLGQSGRGVRLTTHLQLEPRGQENVGLYIHPPPTYAVLGQCLIKHRDHSTIFYVEGNLKYCISPFCIPTFPILKWNLLLRLAKEILQN
jgi:hypothetical protein